MIIKRIISSSLFRDSFWTLLGNALGKGLTVLGGIIIAKLLGKDIFGEYGLLRNTLLLIAIFSTMGLGYTSTIHVAKYKQTNETLLFSLISSILKITLAFSSLIAVLVFIFSSHIANYLEDTSLTIGIKCLSVIIVFNALTTSQIGVLAGFKLFKETAYTNILSGICNFILSVSLTYIYGFNGALLALLLSQIFNCALNHLILRRQLSALNKYGKAPLNSILRQSLPIALQEMSVSATHWLGSIILLKLTDYGEVGLYSAASQWAAVILFIPIALRNVVLSHLSSNQSMKQHNRILYSMISIYALSTFIPATIVVLLSNYITSFYGESFVGLPPVLAACCYATVFNSIYNVFSSEFMSRNRNWLMYAITIARDICILIGIYAFIIIFKITGALSMGLSTLIMGAVTITICTYFYKRTIPTEHI